MDQLKPKNMKRLLLFAALLILLTHFADAQEYHPFPMDNAAWNTVGDNSFSGNIWHFRYAVFGDTIINEMVYSKVYEMYDSTILNPNSTYFAAIRENDDKQVFCLIPGFEETILYDFGAEPGDVIIYPIGGALCEDGIAFWETTHIKTVSSVSTFQLENGESTKKWSFNEFLQDEWVEGIGSIKWYGLFNPLISDITLCGDNYQFACFKQNDTTLFLDNPNCNRCFCDNLTANTPNQLETGNLIEISPNPVQERFKLRSSYFDYKSNPVITVFNITGITQQVSIIRNIDHYLINSNTLSTGVYIVKIQSGDKLEYAKFVKE